jgi:hypothetical protein
MVRLLAIRLPARYRGTHAMRPVAPFDPRNTGRRGSQPLGDIRGTSKALEAPFELERAVRIATTSERRDPGAVNRLRSVGTAAALIRHHRPAKPVRPSD